MYCRCSHCESQQQVSTEQLRHCRGLLTCTACGERFDALATLSDKPEADYSFPGLGKLRVVWNGFSWSAGSGFLACGLLLALLAAQLLYFEADFLRHQIQLRPLWIAVCQRMGCDVTDIAQAEDWSVSHSDMQPYLNRQLMFTAALTHQGTTSQPFPKLQLTLVGLNGEVLAQRIFSGSEYTPQSQLPAGDTQKIQLWLVEPAQGFSGFYVSLL